MRDILPTLQVLHTNPNYWYIFVYGMFFIEEALNYNSLHFPHYFQVAGQQWIFSYSVFRINIGVSFRLTHLSTLVSSCNRRSNRYTFSAASSTSSVASVWKQRFWGYARYSVHHRSICLIILSFNSDLHSKETYFVIFRPTWLYWNDYNR